MRIPRNTQLHVMPDYPVNKTRTVPISQTISGRPVPHIPPALVLQSILGNGLPRRATGTYDGSPGPGRHVRYRTAGGSGLRLFPLHQILYSLSDLLVIQTGPYEYSACR